MSGNDRHAKKKKMAIISVSSIILVAMVIAVAVGVSKSHEDGDSPAVTSKAIESVCQPTDFKETCKTSLDEYAGDVDDPKDLIKLGFEIAMEKLQDAVDNSDTIKELAEDDMGNQALQNCKELIEYSIDDLQRSAEQMEDFDVTKIQDYVEDLKVWISASLQYEQTCLDGFNNTKGEAGEKMKSFLKTSQELTQNALAMATEISNFFGSNHVINQRRLLSKGVKKGVKKAAKKKLKKVPKLGKRAAGAAGAAGAVGAAGAAGEAGVRGVKIIPVWMEGRRLDLANANPNTLRPDVVVAQDGSGKYKTINEALRDIPKNNAAKTFVIYIKQGVYNEEVIVLKDMTNVMFIGDGATRTKITGRKNFADGVQTFKTATVAVIGDYFIAKDIGFENTAGPKGHQAVALRVQSDMSIFFNCQMDGYQDTLYTQTHRQYYRDCTISGTVDFIFGDGAVVFQNCRMIVRNPGPNQSCMVTAQGRLNQREPTGIVLQNCSIVGERGFNPAITKAYLGRPWKPFSRAVVMQSEIDNAITPVGWMEWSGTNNHLTSWFGEFNNRGNGAATNMRVKWYKLVTPEQAAAFAPGNLLLGDKWILPSGVPYVAGMMRI